MTLLGKLFRPWDLSTEETIILNNDEETASTSSKLIVVPKTEDVINEETNKIRITTTSEVRSKTERNNKNELKNKNKTTSQHNLKSSSETLRINSTNKFNLSSGNVNNFISETVISNSKKHPSYFDTDTNNHAMSIMPCINSCEPMSPADFELNLRSNCNCFNGNSPVSSNNTMFLYPSTINELASLSRTELTAMGLLPMESLSSIKVKRQRPKRFHCPHCQVAFSNNGQLKGHIRIHTGERPYECEQEGCGKSFTRNEELTRHRRIHSGLRPFPCSYCGKKFGRKDHLKKHTRTHQRGMYNPGSTLIGYGNPFQQPFHPPIVSTSGFIPSNDLISFQSTHSHYPLSMQPPSSYQLPPPHPHGHNSHYSFPL